MGGICKDYIDNTTGLLPDFTLVVDRLKGNTNLDRTYYHAVMRLLWGSLHKNKGNDDPRRQICKTGVPYN